VRAVAIMRCYPEAAQAILAKVWERARAAAISHFLPKRRLRHAGETLAASALCGNLALAATALPTPFRQNSASERALWQFHACCYSVGPLRLSPRRADLLTTWLTEGARPDTRLQSVHHLVIWDVHLIECTISLTVHGKQRHIRSTVGAQHTIFQPETVRSSYCVACISPSCSTPSTCGKAKHPSTLALIAFTPSTPTTSLQPSYGSLKPTRFPPPGAQISLAATAPGQHNPRPYPYFDCFASSLAAAAKHLIFFCTLRNTRVLNKRQPY
jgi:hypothetical protein